METSYKMDDIEEIALIQGIHNIEEAQLDAELPPLNYNRRQDPFLLPDRQFRRIFRLTKELVENIIILVTPYMVQPRRNSALSPQLKVLCSLKFFASGSYQLDVGSNIFLSISQSSVSRAVEEVANILNRPEIFNHWVKFSVNEENLVNLRNGFFNMYGFPGVIGAIDCTHVAIVPPKTNDPVYPEHMYINRKRYHSINIQLVCDSKLRILSVNSRYPGSTHDNHILSNSNIKVAMERLHQMGYNGYHLLGDSGYYLRAWLLTPTEVEPPPNTNEYRYNACHKSTRSIIERCNGVLKMRFRCLLKHRVLHYTPDKASLIINACVVLHNMCINHNIPEPDLDEELENVDFGIDNFIDEQPGQRIRNQRRINPDLEAGRRKQTLVINGHFRD